MKGNIRKELSRLIGIIISCGLLLSLWLLVKNQQKYAIFQNDALENAVRKNLEMTNSESLIPIHKLRTVTHLDASGVGLRNLAGIDQLFALVELNVSNNHLENFNGLEKLPRLSRLIARSNQVEDLEALRNLDSLRELDLRDNHVADIEPLGGLQKLTYLNLHSNFGIRSIEPLFEHKKIERLVLANLRRMDQASVLDSLPNLERVNLKNTPIDYWERRFLKSRPEPLWETSDENKDSPVVISELSNANFLGVEDEDGDFPDWIELFNRSEKPVDLEGWTVSDRSNQDSRWVFPSYLMKPGEALLVWASGKNKNTTLNSGWQKLPADIASAASWTGSFSKEGKLFDSSGNGNHGDCHNVAKGNDDKVGDYLVFNDAHESSVKVANSASLQIVGDLTLAMWIYPDENFRSCNVLQKSASGEGSIIFNRTGELVYVWGGDESTPNQEFGSGRRLEKNKWTHIMLVRDTKSKLLKWYFNRSQVAQRTTRFSQAKLTENPLLIGRGENGSFRGKLAQIKIFPFAVDFSWLHLDIGLRSSGEKIVLKDPYGIQSDEVQFGTIPSEYSYGRILSSDEQWGFFREPTPGNINGSTALGVQMEPPTFSHNGGFFKRSFDLQLFSKDHTADVLYTLDGSIPDPDNIGGSTFLYKNQYAEKPTDSLGEFLEERIFSFKYDSPIQVKDRTTYPNRWSHFHTTENKWQNLPASLVPKGTIVRARTYKPGHVMSEVVTHTYFVNSVDRGLFPAPVISLAIDPVDLFSYEKGIYTPGTLMDDYHLNERNSRNRRIFPMLLRGNYYKHGRSTERAGHIEIFEEEESSQGLRQNIGVRIHGGMSRGAEQKSLRITARSTWGSDFLTFPLFRDRVNQNFKSFILRNGGQERIGSYFLDGYLHKLVEHLNLDTQAYRPAVVFINGEYWGIHNIRERLSKDFISEKYGIDPGELDFRKEWTMTEGDWDSFNRLQNLVNSAPKNESQFMEELSALMDVDSYIDYIIVQIFARNTDWPHNNYVCWRSRKKYGNSFEDGGDGRWRWMIVDLDFSSYFKTENAYKLNAFEIAKKELLYQKLSRNLEFVERFSKRFLDLLNTIFRPDNMLDLIPLFEGKIKPLLSLQIERWWIPEERYWNESVAEIKTFAKNRGKYMRDHLRDEFMKGDDVKLELDLNDSNRGYIRLNEDIQIKAGIPGIIGDNPYPWTGKYFVNTLVEVKAIPENGYQFSHWEASSGMEVGKLDRMSIVLDKHTSLRAIFEPVE